MAVDTSIVDKLFPTAPGGSPASQLAASFQQQQYAGPQWGPMDEAKLWWRTEARPWLQTPVFGTQGPAASIYSGLMKGATAGIIEPEVDDDEAYEKILKQGSDLFAMGVTLFTPGAIAKAARLKGIAGAALRSPYVMGALYGLAQDTDLPMGTPEDSQQRLMNSAMFAGQIAIFHKMGSLTKPFLTDLMSKTMPNLVDTVGGKAVPKPALRVAVDVMQNMGIGAGLGAMEAPTGERMRGAGIGAAAFALGALPAGIYGETAGYRIEKSSENVMRNFNKLGVPMDTAAEFTKRVFDSKDPAAMYTSILKEIRPTYGYQRAAYEGWLKEREPLQYPRPTAPTPQGTADKIEQGKAVIKADKVKTELSDIDKQHEEVLKSLDNPYARKEGLRAAYEKQYGDATTLEQKRDVIKNWTPQGGQYNRVAQKLAAGEPLDNKDKSAEKILRAYIEHNTKRDMEAAERATRRRGRPAAAKITIPKEKIGAIRQKPYEGLTPGSKEWMNTWKRYPALQPEMLEYQKTGLVPPTPTLPAPERTKVITEKAWEPVIGFASRQQAEAYLAKMGDSGKGLEVRQIAPTELYRMGRFEKNRWEIGREVSKERTVDLATYRAGRQRSLEADIRAAEKKVEAYQDEVDIAKVGDVYDPVKASKRNLQVINSVKEKLGKLGVKEGPPEKDTQGLYYIPINEKGAGFPLFGRWDLAMRAADEIGCGVVISLDAAEVQKRLEKGTSIIVEPPPAGYTTQAPYNIRMIEKSWNLLPRAVINEVSYLKDASDTVSVSRALSRVMKSMEEPVRDVETGEDTMKPISVRQVTKGDVSEYTQNYSMQAWKSSAKYLQKIGKLGGESQYIYKGINDPKDAAVIERRNNTIAKEAINVLMLQTRGQEMNKTWGQLLDEIEPSWTGYSPEEAWNSFKSAWGLKRSTDLNTVISPKSFLERMNVSNIERLENLAINAPEARPLKQKELKGILRDPARSKNLELGNVARLIENELRLNAKAKRVMDNTVDVTDMPPEWGLLSRMIGKYTYEGRQLLEAIRVLAAKYPEFPATIEIEGEVGVAKDMLRIFGEGEADIQDLVKRGAFTQAAYENIKTNIINKVNRHQAELEEAQQIPRKMIFKTPKDLAVYFRSEGNKTADKYAEVKDWEKLLAMLKGSRPLELRYKKGKEKLGYWTKPKQGVREFRGIDFEPGYRALETMRTRLEQKIAALNHINRFIDSNEPLERALNEEHFQTLRDALFYRRAIAKRSGYGTGPDAIPDALEVEAPEIPTMLRMKKNVALKDIRNQDVVLKSGEHYTLDVRRSTVSLIPEEGKPIVLRIADAEKGLKGVAERFKLGPGYMGGLPAAMMKGVQFDLAEGITLPDIDGREKTFSGTIKILDAVKREVEPGKQRITYFIKDGDEGWVTRIDLAELMDSGKASNIMRINPWKEGKWQSILPIMDDLVENRTDFYKDLDKVGQEQVKQWGNIIDPLTRMIRQSRAIGNYIKTRIAGETKPVTQRLERIFELEGRVTPEQRRSREEIIAEFVRETYLDDPNNIYSYKRTKYAEDKIAAGKPLAESEITNWEKELALEVKSTLNAIGEDMDARGLFKVKGAWKEAAMERGYYPTVHTKIKGEDLVPLSDIYTERINKYILKPARLTPEENAEIAKRHGTPMILDPGRVLAYYSLGYANAVQGDTFVRGMEHTLSDKGLPLVGYRGKARQYGAIAEVAKEEGITPDELFGRLYKPLPERFSAFSRRLMSGHEPLYVLEDSGYGPPGELHKWMMSTLAPRELSGEIGLPSWYGTTKSLVKMWTLANPFISLWQAVNSFLPHSGLGGILKGIDGTRLGLPGVKSWDELRLQALRDGFRLSPEGIWNAINEDFLTQRVKDPQAQGIGERMKRAVFDQWGLREKAFGYIERAGLVAYYYKRGQFERDLIRNGMAPEQAKKEAGYMAADFISQVGGVPDQMTYSGLTRDMFRYGFLAGYNMTTVLQQAAYAAGGVPKVMKGGKHVPIPFEQLLGIHGWDKTSKSLLVKNYQYHLAFQLFGYAMTVGLASKMLSGIYPWEREDPQQWLKMGTGIKDSSGNEILITPPMFKDIRDIWELVLSPRQWAVNKADPTLKAMVEFITNNQILATGTRPLVEPGTPMLEGALETIAKKVIPATPLAMVTPLRKYGELYPKALGEEVAGTLGFRTSRGIGGVGEAANYAYKLRQLEKQQALQYKRLTDEMERAWVEGDVAAAKRLARERAKNPRSYQQAWRNFMVKHTQPQQYWQSRAKKLRPEFQRQLGQFAEQYGQ